MNENSQVSSVVASSTATATAHNADHKKHTIKRRLRQKSIYLYNLSCDVAEHKPLTKYMLEPAQRDAVLGFIDGKSGTIPTRFNRLRAKLQLAKRKDELKLPQFDIDALLGKQLKDDILRVSKEEGERRDNEEDVVPRESSTEDHDELQLLIAMAQDEKSVGFAGARGDQTPQTLINKLQGVVPLRKEPLKVLWRDYVTRPPMKNILSQLSQSRHSPYMRPSTTPTDVPIEYVWFQKNRHALQTNELLRRNLYPGIDISDEHEGIIAMYGRKVVGCCFMDTSAKSCYIMYLAVESGWQRSGIGKQLIYLALLQNPTKEFSVHCQALNWRAMATFTSLGFKAEQFCVGFYDKYVPWKLGDAPNEWNTSCTRNAFLMKLRQKN